MIGICILLSGCSQVESKDLPIETVKAVNKDALMDQGPVRGGTLRLFSTYPDTFNPVTTSNIYVREMLLNIYEGMVRLDNHLNPVPVLAEKWTVSEDLTTWTFTLKKDVFWQDNIPFTAEDVEFTVDAILKYGWQSSYRSSIDNIAAFVAVDKYTFKISLKTPNAFTAEMMTFPILAKHYYLGEDFATTEKNSKPMGTGPYRLVSYEPKKFVMLIMNDKWWGTKGIKKEDVQLPYITELQYNLYEVGKDEVNAFQDSDIDVSGISNLNASKYRGRQDLIIRKYPNRDYDFIAFNLSKPALSVKAVRQSIAYAIDKNKLLNDVMDGQVTLSDMPAIPNTWISDKTKNFYEYDIDKAKKILSDDGWKQTQYGLYRYVDGNYAQLTFELLVNSENDSRVHVAQYLADELSKIGIQVTLKKVDFNTFQGLLASKNYDMAIVGSKVPLTPDFSFLFASWNNRARSSYCYNIAGFRNTNMDNLLANIMSTRGTLEDSTKLKQIYGDIRSMAMEELPYLGLYFYNDSIISSKKIRGAISPSVTDRYNNITRWYIP